MSTTLALQECFDVIEKLMVEKNRLVYKVKKLEHEKELLQRAVNLRCISIEAKEKENHDLKNQLQKYKMPDDDGMTLKNSDIAW